MPHAHAKLPDFKLNSKDGPLYHARCDACAAISIQAFTAIQLVETRNKAIRGKPDVEVRKANTKFNRAAATINIALMFLDWNAGRGLRLSRDVPTAVLQAVVWV